MTHALLRRIEQLEAASVKDDFLVLATERDAEGRLYLVYDRREHRQEAGESDNAFCDRARRETGSVHVVTPEDLRL